MREEKKKSHLPRPPPRHDTSEILDYDCGGCVTYLLVCASRNPVEKRDEASTYFCRVIVGGRGGSNSQKVDAVLSRVFVRSSSYNFPRNML